MVKDETFRYIRWETGKLFQGSDIFGDSVAIGKYSTQCSNQLYTLPLPTSLAVSLIGRMASRLGSKDLTPSTGKDYILLHTSSVFAQCVWGNSPRKRNDDALLMRGW